MTRGDSSDDGPEPGYGDTVSEAEFSAISDRFCHSYALADVGDHAPGLFAGRVSAGSLRDGIHVSTANVMALGSSEHSVIFPTSVCFVVSLDGTSSEFHAGQGQAHVLGRGETAMFSFSDHIQSLGRYHAGQLSKSVLIQLRQDQLFDEELSEYTWRQTRNSQSLRLGYDPKVAALAENLFTPHLCGTVRKLMFEGQALELVARTVSAHEDRRRNLSGPDRSAIGLERVRELLETHPERDHSLSDLAREAGMSVSGLKVKFRDRFGEPVIVYLRNARMKRARIGLSREGWSVKRAALFTGYQHPANFSTAFRRHFGVSPKAYQAITKE